MPFVRSFVDDWANGAVFRTFYLTRKDTSARLPVLAHSSVQKFSRESMIEERSAGETGE